MDYNIVLFFTMLAVFISYVSFIWIKYGIQESISASYYVLPRKLNLLFTLFCWGFAIPAMIIGNTALMFLAGAGIAFVGAAAQTKFKMTRTVHLIGAISGILLSQVATIVDYKMWYLSVIYLIIGLPILFLDKKHNVWWLEIMAFISICVVLGIKIF